MNTTPPIPDDDLAQLLRTGLAGAADRAAPSPDARRRIDQRVRVRRRRSAGRRAGTVLAVAAVGSGAFALSRRPLGTAPSEVRTGTPPQAGTTVPAAPATGWIVPGRVPPGFALTEASVKPMSPTGSPDVSRAQFFRKAGNAGTRPFASLAVLGSPSVPRATRPGTTILGMRGSEGDRTVTAGPHQLVVTHTEPAGMFAGFDDGGRSVRLRGSDGLSEDDLVALVASLRWDEGSDRYRVQGDAAGLGEIDYDEAARSAPHRLATVRLRKPGMTDVMVETHLGSPPGTVDVIASSPGSGYEPIEVAGRHGVIDERSGGTSQMVSILVPWPDGAYTEVRSFSLIDRPANPPAGFGVSVGRDELLAVAGSLRPATPAEWDALPKG